MLFLHLLVFFFFLKCLEFKIILMPERHILERRFQVPSVSSPYHPLSPFSLSLSDDPPPQGELLFPYVKPLLLAVTVDTKSEPDQSVYGMGVTRLGQLECFFGTLLWIPGKKGPPGIDILKYHCFTIQKGKRTTMFVSLTLSGNQLLHPIT